MAYSRKSKKALFIDQEALSTLALVQEGLLHPVDGLMDEKTSEEVNHTKCYKGHSFPFSFILAPKGRRNEEVLKALKPGEIVDLFVNGKPVGWLKVDEVFKIDPEARVQEIYGTQNASHPGVQATMKRLGHYAVSGKYHVEYPSLRKIKEQITVAKNRIGAKQTSALMMAARPLHRAHERLIRTTLDRSDLVVIFLFKPYQEDSTLPYELRYRSMDYFVKNYLPANRVVIVPLEYTYIFAGYNEVILDALVAENFGCDELVIGQNHAGLGSFYDKNRIQSVFDHLKGFEIQIHTAPEYAYCDICRTLVSSRTCPHGEHHHISYHADSILELLKKGLLPPAVLIRKEISAMILTHLFPNRFENLEKIYYDLMPGSGLLESQSEEDFYIKLMKLYQTTSLK
ncbi:sulfate adenylyltransferase [Hydrogenimonas cancrithermarum]|uniref:Sulfate adenylyltransferase n=1 Tax=Hydrogenimonas cancrithermarum TaxID=2993563 RepID=A0ABM8FN50_9BACT|nr:sulfate adenylyltransferase [Hydrogenimonas cancrithermarum]BDY13825.1 sulfate adenylyltransferase [Hydrogenimonas cancrithermarum]